MAGCCMLSDPVLTCEHLCSLCVRVHALCRLLCVSGGVQFLVYVGTVWVEQSRYTFQQSNLYSYRAGSSLAMSADGQTVAMGAPGATSGQGELLVAVLPDSCQQCPTGRWAASQGLPAFDHCTLCNEGTASSALGATSVATCATCPAGQWSGQGYSVCTSCSAGTYSSSGGLTAQSQCSTCTQGSYCPGGAAITACPGNTVTLSTGSASITACRCASVVPANGTLGGCVANPVIGTSCDLSCSPGWTSLPAPGTSAALSSTCNASGFYSSNASCTVCPTNSIWQWGPPTSMQHPTIPNSGTSPYNPFVTLSADGSTLVFTTSSGYTVCMHRDPVSLNFSAPVLFNPGNGVQSVALDATGRTLLTTHTIDSTGANLWLWNAGTNTFVQTINVANNGAIGSTTQYGHAGVAMSGDGNTFVVGGPGDNSGAGALWPYVRSGSSLSNYVNGLRVSDSGALGLGTSCALDYFGLLLVAGAPGAAGGIGGVYVFKRSSATQYDWTQQGAVVTCSGGSSTGCSGGSLGLGISISMTPAASWMAVGASGGGNGSVWIFASSNGGSSWVQSATLNSSSPSSLPSAANFSASVALSGDGNRLVVGAPGYNSGSGALIFYARRSGGWQMQGSPLQSVTPAGVAAQQGTQVVLSGDAQWVAQVAPYPLDGQGGVYVGAVPDCATCPAGHYCPDVQGSPIACAPGQRCPSEAVQEACSIPSALSVNASVGSCALPSDGNCSLVCHPGFLLAQPISSANSSCSASQQQSSSQSCGLCAGGSIWEWTPNSSPALLTQLLPLSSGNIDPTGLLASQLAMSGDGRWIAAGAELSHSILGNDTNVGSVLLYERSGVGYVPQQQLNGSNSGGLFGSGQLA